MPTYQTRPVKPKVVEAIKWTGDNNESVAAFLNWSAPVVPSDDESFWYGELHVRLNDWIVIDTVLPMKFRRCTLIDDDAFIARYEPKEEKA